MKERRFSKNTRRILFTAAIILELAQFSVQALPVVGQVMGSVIGGVFFAFSFIVAKVHGIKFVKPKKVLGLGVVTFIELMPLIGALPGWTIYVWRLVADNKKNTEPPVGEKTAAQETNRI